MTTLTTPLFLYVAMYYMAIAERYLDTDLSHYKRATLGIPWLLLPEAMAEYTGLARAAKFERAVPEYSTDYPWMVFPNQEDLPYITKDNIEKSIKYHIPQGPYYNYAVQERTCIQHFDQFNFGHHSYHDLRCYFIYNGVFDDMIRKMINIRMRASDMYYINGSEEECIDGKELAGHVEQFNWLAAIYVAGIFFQKTEILMTRNWFEEIVKDALNNVCYPEEMKSFIMKKMRMPDWVAERIENLEFDITEDDALTVMITSDLNSEFREMFSRIYRAMYMEL